MLRLSSHCICIDLNGHAGVMKIPLNTLQCTPMNGFQHLYLAIGNARVLIEYYTRPGCTDGTLQPSASKQHFFYCDPYRVIRDGIVGGITNLAVPSDTYEGLPSRRTVGTYRVWDREPSTRDVEYNRLPSLEKCFCVSTFELKIDFNAHTLRLQDIPLWDWLQRPENRVPHTMLSSMQGYTLNGHSITATLARWTLQLGECEGGVLDDEVRKMVNLMDLVCARLGLPNGEVKRIVGVMLEVWGEERGGEV
jgi:hypothetical protein